MPVASGILFLIVFFSKVASLFTPEKFLFRAHEKDFSWVEGKVATSTSISFTLERMSAGSSSVRSSTISEMVSFIVNSGLLIIRSSVYKISSGRIEVMDSWALRRRCFVFCIFI